MCLDKGPTINVPEYLSQYNVVGKTPKEYMKIAAQLLLHGKGQVYGKGEG